MHEYSRKLYENEQFQGQKKRGCARRPFCSRIEKWGGRGGPPGGKTKEGGGATEHDNLGGCGGLVGSGVGGGGGGGQRLARRIAGKQTDAPTGSVQAWGGGGGGGKKCML